MPKTGGIGAVPAARPRRRKRLRRWAKRLALVASRWMRPLSIYRWTGLLPFRPIALERFGPERLSVPDLFQAPEPPGATPGARWTPSRPAGFEMGHWVEISGGLVSAGGYVFDPDGRLVQAASHKYRDPQRRAWVDSPYRIWPSIDERSGTVAALTASNQHYYFHWLMEVLPRLGMLLARGTPVEALYLQNAHAFQRQSMRLLGEGLADSVIDCDHTPMLAAGKLVVPCHQIAPGRAFPKRALSFLRRSFLAGPATAGRPVRIYVSRCAARHRRVRNEPQLVDLLRGHGFVDLQLEKLPFAEQVRLFRNAEVVVAPHGGGLANLVFCSRGTRVIELFPAATFDVYYRLSRALGLAYGFVTDRAGRPDRWVRTDYRIEPADLSRALADAGVSRGGR